MSLALYAGVQSCVYYPCGGEKNTSILLLHKSKDFKLILNISKLKIQIYRMSTKPKVLYFLGECTQLVVKILQIKSIHFQYE